MAQAQEWISEFKELHARFKKGELKGAEERLYFEAREQLARAMVAAQGMTVPEGAAARRTFRVAQGIQVELSLASGTVKAVTQDISTGGFSVTLAQPPDEAVGVGVSLKLPGQIEKPLGARARVVSVQRKTGAGRVSFSFESLPETELVRLETVLFDCALARMR